jgi:hypothetical protein
LADSIRLQGFDNITEPISGTLLIRNKEQRFVYTDGNRRLGILAALYSESIRPSPKVVVTVQDCIDETYLFGHPTVQMVRRKYRMPMEDVRRWFDHVFHQN